MGVSPVSVWEGWEAGARNEMEEDVAVTRAVCNRAGNEPSRKMKFHNHGEGLYYASTRAFSLLVLPQMRYYAKHKQALIIHGK